jgi:hypothetical protein
MRSKIMPGAAIAVLLAGSLAAASPAEARWRGHHGGGWGGGGAVIGGLAAGALIGGALASSRPYGYYGGGYGYGYAPVYEEPVYAAPGGDEVSYCMSRFKSYDPASGTYLGYDGARHPCP